MNILSIQSHVAYGHVGNASATFPLQRLGCEVWAVHTVQFSNHTGYGAWKGRVFDAPMIDELVDGIADRGVLPRCNGVLSGYMGSADIGNAILSAAARVKSANPSALYCCDPVIGDVGRGVFVRPGIPEFMRDQALPAADILTPNQFELDFLSGVSTTTLPLAKQAVLSLLARGPKVMLVTSLLTEETPDDCVDLLATAGQGFFRVRTPRLGLSINGAGDAIAALFFFYWLKSGDVAEAVARAASAVFGLLKRTEDAGSREILLIDAQDELVTPSTLFTAQAV
jgi:pyridoxine kinase